MIWGPMALENQEKQGSGKGEIIPPNTPSDMDTTSIQLGHIEVLQILNEHGEVDSGLEPDFDNKTLVDIYYWMVLSRAFDQRMLTMQRQ